MRRGFMIGIVVVLFLTAAAPIQAQVTLKWKFKEGDKFYAEENALVKQTITVLGQREEKEERQTTVVSFRVVKATPDNIVIEQTIEKVKNEVIRGKIDREDEKTSEKMQGAKFLITLNGSGKITKFDGYDALVTRLSDGNENVAKVFRALMPKETLQKFAEQTFSLFPEKPVKINDTWDRETSISLGPIGILKAKNRFVYVGKEGALEAITQTGQLSYFPPVGNNPDVPFKVIKGNMVAENAKGKVLFDPKLGRPVQESNSMTLRGTMTMEILNMQVNMDLHMEQSATTRIMTTLTPPPPPLKEGK